MAKKSKPASPFTGRWRIVSMGEWDVDYMEKEGPAFIEFGADQMGEFRFSLTSGGIDYRITERGRQPAAEWPGRRKGKAVRLPQCKNCVEATAASTSAIPGCELWKR